MASARKHFVLMDPKHNVVTFAPGDELPEWAESMVTNPAVVDSLPAGGDDESDDDVFDPAGHDVNDVLEYLQTADADEVDRVLKAESDGKARKTILSFTPSDDIIS